MIARLLATVWQAVVNVPGPLLAIKSDPGTEAMRRALHEELLRGPVAEPAYRPWLDSPGVARRRERLAAADSARKAGSF